MISAWSTNSPRDTSAFSPHSRQTRATRLQRYVQTKSMTLRGNCPPSMHKRVTSPGDHGSMYSNRIRTRPPETPKIRLPKGHLKPLEEGTFEAKHFDSDQQHRCRNAIQSAEFKDAVWPWWCRLKRDKSGTALTRDSYLLISCRIFKILLGQSKINDQKLVQAAELDWQIDMLMDDPTSEIMAQRQFYRSMFVIADVWALTNELDDLCAFLGVLYVQLQQTVGFHRSRRNNDENYGIYDNHLQKSMSSIHSSLSVHSLFLPIKENDSNRWPNVERGRSYSFGLRCPMPQADVSSYPGPNAYLPKFESISSPYAKGKGYPGAKGASFSSGPKSWTRSMAFAAMSGHAGILNPPHYSGWPTPRKDGMEMQPPSFWRPTSTKAPERTKTQKYYDSRVEEKTVLGLQKRNAAHEKLLLKYKKVHYLKASRKKKLLETATIDQYAETTTNVDLWAKEELLNAEAQRLLEKIKRNPELGVLPRGTKLVV